MSIQQIDIQQFHTVWEAEQPLLIDVRETSEYEEAHVPGAKNIPLQQIVTHAGTLPTQQPVYLICRSGMRSNKAAQLLMQHNETLDLINITGGTMAWIKAGLPTNQGGNP